MVSKILKLLILSFSLLYLQPTMASNKAKAKYTKKTADEILKKYGSHRPKDTLTLTDSMPVGDRIDLENKHFLISYPKCFRVEDTIPDSDANPGIDSPSISIIREKSCPNFSQNLGSNWMTVELDNGYIEPDKFDRFQPPSMAVYRQLMKVNGNKAISILRVGSSMAPETQYAPELYWNVYIACNGKKDELFRIGFPYHIGEDVIPYLEKKNFELPSDYKQIISSFKCRKDR